MIAFAPTAPDGLGREERAKRLDDGIARIGANLDAALYRQLVMIREFDELEGWHLAGFRSCAAWLSWRIGVAPGAARERVRVARALEPLPALSDAFRRGRLSYSAARALTRIATPENEVELVEVARHTTAAQLERLVRGWRMLDRAYEETGEREPHEQRKLSLLPDPCGSWVMGARLDPEVGAESDRALAWAEAILRTRGVLEPDATPGQRRADAYALVIEAALGGGLEALAEGIAGPGGRDAKPVVDDVKPDGGSAKAGGRGPKRRRGLSRAGRYQVVVHVSAETLRQPAEGTGRSPDGVGEPTEVDGEATSMADESRIEGGPRVSAETARRLSCDAGIVVMTHDRDGNVLDVGRRRRSLPTPIRRALEHRDGCCRFPGCTSRAWVCDGHHVHHWIDGGETKLDNLALLCRWHHRRVHEDGWRMELCESGEARFYRPDGRRLPEVTPRPEVGEDPAGTLEREGRHLAIDEWTATTRWIGDPLDVDWALFTLWRPRVEEASESDGSDRTSPRRRPWPGACRGRSGRTPEPARSRGDARHDTFPRRRHRRVPAETSPGRDPAAWIVAHPPVLAIFSPCRQFREARLTNGLPGAPTPCMPREGSVSEQNRRIEPQRGTPPIPGGGLTRRAFLTATAAGLALPCAALRGLARFRPVRGAGGVSPQDRPVPSPSQLLWQRDELALFLHFGVNTFTDREWGDGTEDPAIFDPARLDAGQWARVARETGFKAMILTAKHHDGFCLWPTDTTRHSVASSPWRGGDGDVVREFVDACRAEGLRAGLYCSPWDRNAPSYGDSPRYNDMFVAQLTELLTRYGPIHEVWFDGANGEGPNGRRQEYDWPRFWGRVRELQPEAVIFSDAGPDVRWIGNEVGSAGATNWSTVDPDVVPYPGATGDDVMHMLQHGDPEGTVWRPGETDVSIRPGWFYHAAENSEVRSVENLVELYFTSVGRNSKLLLNIPPTPDGLLPETDVARLRGMHEALTRLFETDLAAGVAPHRQRVDQRLAVEGLDLGRVVEAGIVELREPIELGQTIRRYTVEATESADGDGWRPIAAGTTVGYKRLDRFEPVPVRRLRVHLEDLYGEPPPIGVRLYAG